MIKVIHLNHDIKSSWPEESFVKIFFSIGGTDHYDTLVLYEAVHFREQLVDGLVGVGVMRRVGSLLSHAVYLVNEDNAGCLLFSFFCISDNTSKIEVSFLL